MKRLLVIDDEEGLRDFLEDALTRKGWSVDTAKDGREGMTALSEHAYDVVITDLKMPGPDGLEIVRYCQREQPQTQVLVITAHGTVSNAVEAIKLGAFDYLQKPISGPEELRLIVDRAAERKAFLTQRAGTGDQNQSQPPLKYQDQAMDPVLHALERAAPTETSILLTGESGTGKEVAARTIHALSSRKHGPFVAMNCAAVSENLLESELFGHEKGAFTGATTARPGRIEMADSGTLFLDEIGELKPSLQAKLLRVLQEHCYERVGGTRTHRANVRWLAATNRNLEEEISQGTFREDLFHRLAVFPIHLPALRDRQEDIAPMAAAMLERICLELGRTGLELASKTLEELKGAVWTGNARELRNVLERAAILAEGPYILPTDLLLRSPTTTLPEKADSSGLTLSDLEANAIAQALTTSSGNRKQAAEALGIGLRTLYEKIKKYGLS